MPTQALITAMEELIHLHESLLPLSKEKTRVLVYNQVEELNRIVHQESLMVRQIAESESRRIETVNRFLAFKGFKPNPRITMNELLKLVFKADEKQKLLSLQNRLLQLVDELKELNELNRRLVEQSLGFIEYSLDLLTGPDRSEAVYQHPAQTKNGGSRAIRFDTKV